MAFIETISVAEAKGDLKKIYNSIQKTRGGVAAVHQSMSLEPAFVVKHMDLYMEVMFGKGALKRVLREMIAVVVSSANNCAYCTTHHSDAVNQYWKDDEKVKQLATDFSVLDLKESEFAMLSFAYQLTVNYQNTDYGIWVDQLKEAGLSDKAVLEAVMIISYFNFINRIVLSLGVKLEDD